MISKNKDFALPAPWPFCCKKYGFVFLSLFFVLMFIYGNSLDCSWHFDDYKNIVENANIRLQKLSWEDIKKAFIGLPDEGMTRPLAYLSFALNYYIGGTDVLGYHLVNIFIHYATAIFLFFFVYRTMNLPLLKEQYGGHSYSIALLATFLWALHPIQVFAVTYIVQRMASMAAMFYILAMFFYLLGRTAGKKSHMMCYFVLSALTAFMALGSKENAVMLPVVIFFYDLLLIRGVDKESLRKYFKLSIIPLLLLILAGLLFVDPAKLLDGYRIRPFTMAERLLTEPRVIIFYVTLLLYPLSSRFTLLHDIDISTGLFSPWTTIPAILILVFVLALALFYARRKPLFSFCVIFFFLNHVVESSFLSLEIIYEHRNYLPSLLFFVPFAVLAVRCLDYFSNRKAVFISLTAALTFFMIVEGVAVVLQNDTLKYELSLWLDNVEKSPRLHRPHHNLAMEYLALGLLPAAFAELQQALDAKVTSATYQKYDTYYSLGQCYRLMGDDDRALKQFEECIKLADFFPDVYQGQAEIMMARGRYDDAEKAIRRALYLNSRIPSFHATYGEVLLKKGNFDGALGETRKALILNGPSPKAYGIMAEIFQARGETTLAAHFRLISQNREIRVPYTVFKP